MAVRNTRTGGARKRVAGELKKGATRLKKKPPTVVTASRPNMNEQYKEPKVNAPKTPVAKPAVKKPVLTKKNPGNMNNQQMRELHDQMSKPQPKQTTRKFGK